MADTGIGSGGGTNPYDPLSSAYTSPSAFPGANAANAETSGTNPVTGFASRYNPDQLKQIWDTPWSILPDVFQGMNTAGPGYQSLRDLGGDPLTLYNLMAGRSSDLAGAGVGGYTNWLADLMKSMGTVGGRGFSAKELLFNLFNPQGPGDAAGNHDNSALYNILTAGGGSDQMRTIFNFARDATNVGMNPLAARGYQNALARAGDTAINQQMKQDSGEGANNMPIYQLLRQIAPGLMT